MQFVFSLFLVFKKRITSQKVGVSSRVMLPAASARLNCLIPPFFITHTSCCQVGNTFSLSSLADKNIFVEKTVLPRGRFWNSDYITINYAVKLAPGLSDGSSLNVKRPDTISIF